MNCRTSQFELSQCLDGRLASGRRTAVMDHVAACPTCASFWDDLQKAQSLVLRLPQQHVSEEFREGLFLRIESGEGTPEAVFHEPIPTLTKVRYVLTGAAAAAALLVAASFLRGHPSGGEQPSRTTEPIASVDTTGTGSGNTGLHHRDQDNNLVQPASDQYASLAGFGQLAPATPSMFATEAARRFQGSFNSASMQARSFVRQPSPDAARSICENARELKQFGSLLLDLRDSESLFFADNRIDRELHDLVAALDLDAGHQRAADDLTRQVVLPALQRAGNLNRLQSALLVRPDLSPADQLQQVWRLFEQRPEPLMQMFEFLPHADFESMRVPTPGQVFALGDGCGQVFVIVRRR